MSVMPSHVVTGSKEHGSPQSKPDLRGAIMGLQRLRWILLYILLALLANAQEGRATRPDDHVGAPRPLYARFKHY